MADLVGSYQPIYRLLGPVIAHGKAGVVSNGAPKLMSVLAALLLHANQVVPADRLFTLVWGERPPPSVRGRLRVYISELRAVLGHKTLIHSSGGYQINVGAGELDLQIFADAVASARTMLRAEQTQAAVEQLRRALSLWTGPALSGVTLDLAAQERPGLEERRLAALEELFDAELACGQHNRIIAELRHACADNPFRERLTAQLMMALHRAGRTAEALDLYTVCRQRLVDELGIGPGQLLRETQLRILQSDSESAPRAPKGQPGAFAPVGVGAAREHNRARHRPVTPRGPEPQNPFTAHQPPLAHATPASPGNLPHRIGLLVGRDAEAKRVVAALREAPLVTLTGVGGVGKSRLALEVASLDESHFPDGVWVCELAPLPRHGSVSGAVAISMQVQPRHKQTVERSLIEYLKSRQLLLILDNCEHVLDEASRLARRIISHCPGIVVLATSREALGVPGERVCKVPPLSIEDATQLFVRRARAADPGFHPDESARSRVVEICHRLDGLPLAIELAAARIPVLGPAEVATRLHDQRLLTRPSRAGQSHHESLGTAIDWSYQLLAEPEQTLFTRLSIFSDGASLTAIHAVCTESNDSEADTLDLLSALVAKSMLVAECRSGGTRYRLLETLRIYARERLRDDHSLTRRHACHFVELAERTALGVQGPDEQSWVERALPEANNMRAAFEWTLAQRNADMAMRLVISLPEVAQVRLGWEAFGWAEEALTLASPSHPLYVAALGAAARGAWSIGDFPRARQLAALAGERNPARGTARPAYPADVAADVDLYEGNVDRALHHYLSQADLARGDHDPIRLVVCLYMIAVCQSARRAPQLGVAAAHEAVEVAETTRNPSAMSMAHYALGLVLKKSDPKQALQRFDLATALASSVHNLWWRGIAIMEAAATRTVHGDPEDAARMLVEVLDHWDRVGDQTQLWLALRYVTRLFVRLDAEGEAMILHHCLVTAGKPSPFGSSLVSGLAENLGSAPYAAAAARGSTLSLANAVLLARSRLLSGSDVAT